MPLIDVHTHSLTPLYLAAMRAAGIEDVEGFALPAWSEPEHLALMDRNDIACSILSISAPGIHFLANGAARDLARRINEDAAARTDRSGGRFGAFAILTLPDIDGALRELDYALDVLKLDGIGLLTNVGGVYLGSPAFDPILQEAHRRGAVVYVHPVAPPGFAAFSQGFSGSTVEYPFDTTRMVLNMIACGTFRRYTNMRLIVSHGGGTIPYLAERISNLTAMFNRQDPPLRPQEAIAQLKSIYYDTTAIANPVSLASFRAFVPVERQLYGSDAPFMPEFTIPPSRAALATAQGAMAEQFAEQQFTNATSLFPRLARFAAAPV